MKNKLLPLNLQYFADGMEGPEGDPAGSAQPTGTEPPVQDPPKEKTFTQQELNTVAAREYKESRQAIVKAVSPLLKKYGINPNKLDGNAKSAEELSKEIAAIEDKLKKNPDTPDAAPAVDTSDDSVLSEYKEQYQSLLMSNRKMVAENAALKAGFQEKKIPWIVKSAIAEANNNDEVVAMIKQMAKDMPELKKQEPKPSDGFTGSSFNRGGSDGAFRGNSAKVSKDLDKELDKHIRSTNFFS